MFFLFSLYNLMFLNFLGINNLWHSTGKYKIKDSKIFSIQWLNIDTVLICFAEGQLYIIQFFKFSIVVLDYLKMKSSIFILFIIFML
jgi:hypothetical protein